LNGWFFTRMIWPEHRDLLGGGHVLGREEASVLLRPVADERQLDVGALDLTGPVLIAGNQLRPRVHARREVLNARHLSERGGVIGGQRGGHAAALPNAALGEVARVDRDQVRAGRLDLFLDRGLRALAERHHRDHRADADDHAEHRQHRAHLVAIQRLERDQQRHEYGHRFSYTTPPICSEATSSDGADGISGSGGGNAASSCAALRRFSIF
jgi:hypothetical protein